MSDWTMKSGVLMHKDGSGADIANSTKIAPQLVQRLLDDYEQLESESAAKDERIAEGDMQLKNQIELLEEDIECVHKWLDDQRAPRYEDEKELSIVGRIMRIGNG